MESREIITIKDVRKSFFQGTPNELEVLHGISLCVREGEFVAVMGESGSGKSTLMHIIGVLDRADSGTYQLDGIDVNLADDKELSTIRNRKVGFVFQNFNLIGRQNALKNVELPMLYAGIGKRQRTSRAEQLLEEMGMAERMKHKPNELSGGQKQRVSIARALANNPSIILADEPTGALDSETSRTVMDIFHRLHEEEGKTILLITHNRALAGECQRILTMKDGCIVKENVGGGGYGDF